METGHLAREAARLGETIATRAEEPLSKAPAAKRSNRIVGGRTNHRENEVDSACALAASAQRVSTRRLPGIAHFYENRAVRVLAA